MDEYHIIFENVPLELSIDEIQLILENKRYTGDGDFEIDKIYENTNNDKRDILLKYKSIESAQAILNKEKIIYRNIELIPSVWIPSDYQIKETFKFPFYLLYLNQDFLHKFENELNNYNFGIKLINEENIIIEKTGQDDDSQLGKKWTDQLEDCIKNFQINNFDQLELRGVDEKSWPSIRSKAIDLCTKSDRLSLIYRNKPDNYLRIDGDKQLIEKIIDEKYFFN